MRHNILALTALTIAISACTGNPEPSSSAGSEKTLIASEQTQNLLLQEFKGPYQGVPAFDRAKLEDLKPALREAMTMAENEFNTIANNPEPANFENTLVELEKSAQALNRVYDYWGVWSNNVSSEAFREVQKEMVPELSAFDSRYKQNTLLFERIKTVYESEEIKTLGLQEQRLALDYYNSFALEGATLSGDQKVRYAEIDQELATLYTQFGNNVLADEENYVLFINESELSGLPQSFVDAAASAAEEREQAGKYAITNTRSSMDPFLRYSDERELREKVWRTYYSRGDNGDEFDNNKIAAQILKLRDERVALLGFDNYAQWRLQDRMAKTPERALELLEAIWPAAIARVEEEVADMQALADSLAESNGSAKITIEPWDYRYYAEKVRKQKYDLDSDEVKQYMQLDKLREAMFYVAGRLFNFKFTALEKGIIPVFHDDVMVWEVTDITSGEHIGLWYLDPFARKGKRSGAWATSYRQYSTYNGKKNVLSSNNSNFIKGKPGEPVLISWDDAETYFHEFGHALHSLSSTVKYPTLNRGVRDYTEFQSQLLERWLFTDEVINNYLVHYKTGEAIPAELVAKIKKAATFNEGFKTTEYLASALIDMKLHTMDPSNIDIDAFEKEALSKLGMPSTIVMRHRTPQFGHIFTNEAYSSGYYGYIWAEVLTSDAAEAFANAPGGFYDEALAKKLVQYLFSARNSIDPVEAYQLFRGRDATIDALMRDRGFPIK